LFYQTDQAIDECFRRHVTGQHAPRTAGETAVGNQATDSPRPWPTSTEAAPAFPACPNAFWTEVAQDDDVTGIDLVRLDCIPRPKIRGRYVPKSGRDGQVPARSIRPLRQHLESGFRHGDHMFPLRG